MHRQVPYDIKLLKLLKQLKQLKQLETGLSINVCWNVCMKLDGIGINISDAPFRDFHRRVVVHKMQGSSKMIREQAERAFDAEFGRPLGSREAMAKEGLTPPRSSAQSVT
ncbi:hypothetical protein WKW80_22620 [Variovorax humicola]|uniref:Uncharacterized protein n=1 Tax=Variovorax humicola TaxID=1769758 RepID=A0ABU8W430_9BURK